MRMNGIAVGKTERVGSIEICPLYLLPLTVASATVSGTSVTRTEKTRRVSKKQIPTVMVATEKDDFTTIPIDSAIPIPMTITIVIIPTQIAITISITITITVVLIVITILTETMTPPTTVNLRDPASFSHLLRGILHLYLLIDPRLTRVITTDLPIAITMPIVSINIAVKPITILIKSTAIVIAMLVTFPLQIK